nr:hypothetical protein [Sclerotinia sclerotiorum deltaflexivirus 1]
MTGSKVLIMSALGATDAPVSNLTSGVSQIGITSPPTPTDIQIPFVQLFNPHTKYRLTAADATLRAYLATYESVQFVSLSFAVEITGQNGKLQFAATPSDISPSGDLDWLGAPVYQRFAGNAQGDTFAEYNFPTSHPFGHELKAVALGNAPPRFFFQFDGSSGDVARIRGRLTLRGGGRGIIPAVSLTELATGKNAATVKF